MRELSRGKLHGNRTKLPEWLRSLPMATDPTAEAKRRGFWLRISRERANLTQAGAAELLGLSNRSKSTLSQWEAGTREPKLRYLNAMARLYGVPLAVFTEPDPSAFEQLEERLAALARAAIRLAMQDSEPGAEGNPPADDEPGSQPRKRPA
jgi:transcriptional regulator with XRE-family HTH domain